MSKSRKSPKPRKSRKSRKSSGKKPVSEWIKHCKAWSKQYKMKYPDVLKDSKCKAAYYANKKK